MLEKVRNILLVISGVGALLSIHFKTMNNFAIDTIRNKYKNVPGKQLIFNTVIKLFSYCFIGIYLTLFIISIIDFFVAKKWGTIFSVPDLGEGWFLFGVIVATVIIIAPFMAAAIAVINLVEIKDQFRKKLENKDYIKVDKKTITWNWIGIILSVIVTITWIILSGYIVTTGIDVVNKEGIYIFQNNILNDNMRMISLFGFLAIISITSFIVLNSLREIYIAINQDESYILIVNNHKVLCKCYLEYEEYFLIFKNEDENYIKKSEIKEIRKVDTYNITNMKGKYNNGVKEAAKNKSAKRNKKFFAYKKAKKNSK
ncbi:hypothetical protein [Clostridium sp. LP20]|uniref:hypothetical protein n=1 Tax=Clostridium sp. LP20 TaxID=3418665 RepID=UPI003EE6E0E0